MSYLLHIETATEDCSVALSCNGKEHSQLIAEEKLSHASMLMPLIDKLFKQAKLTVKDLSAVSFSEGPGSYTGLRIGLSTAKGICYAANIPLISTSTLRAAAVGIKKSLSLSKKDLLFPVIDARRMEVYAMLLDSNLQKLEAVSARIMDENSLDNINSERIIFAGSGAEKLKILYGEFEHCFFVDELVHLATNAISEAYNKWENEDFENLAYYEPFYLKDFVPAKAKVKGLK